MSTTTQHEITDLLERAGAAARGSRHDCPKCGGRRTVTNSSEAFYCHRCQWKGNIITLARDVGLETQLTPEEYRLLRQRMEHAKQAAEALRARVQPRRFELYDELRTLAQIEKGAHTAGADRPEVWDSLDLVYKRRSLIVAELTFLEAAIGPRVERFLDATPEHQRVVCEAILENGGIVDRDGKFIEVTA